MSAAPTPVFPGADETTPSLAQYFSWINNTNEGATEAQTLANLAFFAWLHQEYGMQLDIYAFDAGAIDGCGFYGTISSDRFQRQFPRGFAPLVAAAARFGCRLGIWGGPDGFGDTDAEAQARIETMVSLCRDHRFMLFKFDGVCGQLRPDKVPHFIAMMAACRQYAPDLILLNHRLELGAGEPHATTFLWEGREMYSDVHIANDRPGTHNRVGELSRGLPPGLRRLTEDHGVCLSSCLDYWEDALIQQAFNRCLILAPEIYGNPWLLRDDEFPRLARIFNLHRRYRDLLVHGLVLPAATYGADAVSRGDGQTRLVSLRNLTWESRQVPVTLDASLGLEPAATIQMRRLHPRETVLGEFAWGATVLVEVEPFRACLVLASSQACPEIGFHGCAGEVAKDLPGAPAEVLLWGLPGTTPTVWLTAPGYASATLDGAPAGALLSAAGLAVAFPGTSLRAHWHRRLAALTPGAVPADATALYEATCFAADSNALEVRELQRSGASQIPAVQQARAAFFEQDTFRQRGLWDKHLFDNNPDTFFAVCRRHPHLAVRGGAFRLDFGAVVNIDLLVLSTQGDYHLQPLRNHEAVLAWVSADLRTWTLVRGLAEGDIRLTLPPDQPVRYVRLAPMPDRINEVRGYYRGQPLPRAAWRASNLLARDLGATRAWTATVQVDEVHPGSYLAVPVFGPHVPEAVYAAARCGGRYLGAARRAPSYPANVFEHQVHPGENYSYFIPLAPEHAGKPLEVVLLGRPESAADLTAEVWITAYPTPQVSRRVVLQRLA